MSKEKIVTPAQTIAANVAVTEHANSYFRKHVQPAPKIAENVHPSAVTATATAKKTAMCAQKIADNAAVMVNATIVMEKTAKIAP